MGPVKLPCWTNVLCERYKERNPSCSEDFLPVLFLGAEAWATGTLPVKLFPAKTHVGFLLEVLTYPQGGKKTHPASVEGQISGKPTSRALGCVP